jgi:hypothetical protein
MEGMKTMKKITKYTVDSTFLRIHFPELFDEDKKVFQDDPITAYDILATRFGKEIADKFTVNGGWCDMVKLPRGRKLAIGGEGELTSDATFYLCEICEL